MSQIIQYSDTWISQLFWIVGYLDISTFLVFGYLASQKCRDIPSIRNISYLHRIFVTMYSIPYTRGIFMYPDIQLSRHPTIRIPHLYIQGRTGACMELLFLKTGSLQGEQDPCNESRFFSVIKTCFPCENVGAGNTCFHYRDQVGSAWIIFLCSK